MAKLTETANTYKRCDQFAKDFSTGIKYEGKGPVAEFLLAARKKLVDAIPYFVFLREQSKDVEKEKKELEKIKKEIDKCLEAIEKNVKNLRKKGENIDELTTKIKSLKNTSEELKNDREREFLETLKKEIETLKDSTKSLGKKNNSTAADEIDKKLKSIVLITEKAKEAKDSAPEVGAKNKVSGKDKNAVNTGYRILDKTVFGNSLGKMPFGNVDPNSGEKLLLKLNGQAPYRQAVDALQTAAEASGKQDYDNIPKYFQLVSQYLIVVITGLNSYKSKKIAFVLPRVKHRHRLVLGVVKGCETISKEMKKIDIAMESKIWDLTDELAKVNIKIATLHAIIEQRTRPAGNYKTVDGVNAIKKGELNNAIGAESGRLTTFLDMIVKWEFHSKNFYDCFKVAFPDVKNLTEFETAKDLPGTGWENDKWTLEKGIDWLQKNNYTKIERFISVVFQELEYLDEDLNKLKEKFDARDKITKEISKLREKLPE